MPATSEDAISAPPATIDFGRQAAPARQEPSFAEPGSGPSKLPPSIASAFAAAAYALQHGDDTPAPGERADAGTGSGVSGVTAGQGAGLMPGLYASMIGEPSRDYYLRLFERFDALGKPLPTWNLAAGLFTLPWCGLRGLWQEGGLYALAAGGTGLVWGLLLRPALGLPPAIAHGIDATLVLLAIAIPGLGANALYWHHVRRHTLQAIGEAPTMAEAHERLARHAATPLRKRLAVAAGVVLAAAAGAGAWALSAPAHFMAVQAEAAPSEATPAPPAAAPAVQPPSAAAAPAGEPPKMEAASTPAPMPQPMPQPPVPAAQAEALPDAQPPLPAAGTAVSGMVEPMPVVAAAGAAGAVAAAAVAAGPAKEAPVPAKPLPPAPAPAHTSPPVPTPAPAKPSKPAAESRPARPAEPAAKAAAPARPASTALEPGNYYINIGVFSEAGNAARVVERLEKARLPALSQTLHSNKGEIVRVRSGPFAKQRSAEQAAGKIRALGLEATVFHHDPQEGRSTRR
jgi:cell division septation protein DedD